MIERLGLMNDHAVAAPGSGAKSPLILLPGLLCLLLGIALPTSKLYYQLMILLLWLPSLYLLFANRQDWRSWCTPLMGLVTVFFAWALLSSLWSNGEEPGREIKHALMIYLTLWAGVLAAGIAQRQLVLLLAVCCYCMAALAAVCLFTAYVLYELPLSFRLTSFWQLSHPILAAHVFGFFLMALLHLKPARVIHQAFWCLGLLSLAAFVFFTQSRGVWLALGVGLVFSALLRREWIYVLGAVGGIAVLIVMAILMPNLVTDRGLSYRPELALEGLSLLAQHPWGGLGMGSVYSLPLPVLNAVFDHPHNLFISVGLDLGGVGLLLWLGIWGLVFRVGWRARTSPLGCALLGVWCFASVAFLSDGSGIWSKPREIWFLTWIPLTLALALTGRQGAATRDGTTGYRHVFVDSRR
ncbi:hypothetical protein DNK34_22155 [Pseudomonas dryadis]|uniref:O-antigen ligase-related domain-containing protein n=2 Tax=Pseudomonadales TaxID=72274 RepID=A0A4Q9QVR7_9GAMM|nr:hypothetical protein DNK44_19270 [Pseudomonas dryadis]TBV00998.1 hypothetical protein DNK34_22155 [Pseudomonas dryadis]TBV20050.1 hypothetical protein DNK41_01020 [Pseudomonas sp. FRB 230]